MEADPYHALARELDKLNVSPIGLDAWPDLLDDLLHPLLGGARERITIPGGRGWRLVGLGQAVFLGHEGASFRWGSVGAEIAARIDDVGRSALATR